MNSQICCQEPYPGTSVPLGWRGQRGNPDQPGSYDFITSKSQWVDSNQHRRETQHRETDVSRGWLEVSIITRTGEKAALFNLPAHSSLASSTDFLLTSGDYPLAPPCLCLLSFPLHPGPYSLPRLERAPPPFLAGIWNGERRCILLESELYLK